MHLKDAERGVLKGAMDLLHLAGFHPLRVNSGTVRTAGGHYVRLAPEGTADLFAIVNVSGRAMAVETKRGRGGRVTEAQRVFLASVREAGGVGVVIDDLAVLHRVIRELQADPWAKFDEEGRRLA